MNTPAPFLNTVDASWNRFEEAALPLRASAGSTRIKLGPNFPGGDTSPTGLANDATVYTATVIVDGATVPVSIVGSAAQTVATLVTELIADLGAIVTFVGDEIVITSTTTGAASSVFVSDTGANFLFASLRGDRDPATAGLEKWSVSNYDSTRGWFAIAGSLNRVGTSVRGNTFYLRWDKFDGGHQEQLAAVIDAFLAGGVANTNQPWVNAAAGIAITGAVVPVQNTDSGLSRSTVYQLQLDVNGDGNVTVFVDLNIPQTSGSPFEQVVAALNNGIAAARRADGSALPVVAEWRQGVDTATQPSMIVLRVLDSNEQFSATSAGAVEMGAGTTLVVTDGASNGLVAAITAVTTPIDWTAAIDTAQVGFAVVNFNRVNAAAVTPATVPAVATGNYSVTASFDGAAPVSVVVAVTAADSMSVIAATLDTALAGATVVAVGNKFLLNGLTATGAGSVRVVIPTTGPNPDLFNAIAAALDVLDRRGTTSVQTYGVTGYATPGIDGATNLAFPKTVNSIAYADWEAVLDTTQVGGRILGQYIHGATGNGPLFTSDSAASFEKELRPASTGQCVYGALYWDGLAWRYFVQGDASRLNTDDTSAGTNNPPRTLMHGA